MILPLVNLSAATSLDQSLLASLGVAGDIVLHVTDINDAGLDALAQFLAEYPIDDYWVSSTCDDKLPDATVIMRALDAGAAKVIVSASALLSETQEGSALRNLPYERLVASFDWSVKESEKTMRRLQGLASGFVVRMEALAGRGKDGCEFDASVLDVLARLTAAALEKPLPSGGHARVIITVPEGWQPSFTLVAQIAGIDGELMVPSERLTLDNADESISPPKLNVADALTCSLRSDRPDGLFTTLVVDERHVGLGMVYSSKESVREALRTRTGVYQSRKRGLWRKGATSGAVQELCKVQVDCDKDTLKFVVRQAGSGFCHFNTLTCFGPARGLTALECTLKSRRTSAPVGSYTQRLFREPDLLRAKIMEEADELCNASTQDEVAWEAADLIYFALVKCVANGVSLADVEAQLDRRALKVTRRPGNAKPQWESAKTRKANGKESDGTGRLDETAKPPSPVENRRIEMKVHTLSDLSSKQQAALLQRPITESEDIMSRVRPIVDDVRKRGDAALLDFTEKFDGVRLTSPVLMSPFPPEAMALDDATRTAIDRAYDNIHRFHHAQLDRRPLVVETMPGVECSRFVRPIERVGLYVPGGTALLPSTALMLGIPAKVAGCREIVLACPPRKNGTVAPEVTYVAHKVGASRIVLAGGAQAVAALAYGTESVPKVDKICGPGNQYVTAAKMLAQNDTSAMVSIDMPAGPSEVLVVADNASTPAYVASDLLSQAEHGVDSQVVLVGVALSSAHLDAIQDEMHRQASRLPRVDIVREAIRNSFAVMTNTTDEAMAFANRYAPEHLILHTEDAEHLLEKVENAGSVFVGAFSPESCGDYASGTNHTLPTYGYARMYSGVNTHTFVKHITSQRLTLDGLNALGDTVMQLAEVEGLEAHRNSVAIRIADIRRGNA